MSASSEPKNGPSLRSGFLLGFFLILCLLMTGAAGYVKMRLDAAESALGAPEKAFSTDEALYEKTVLTLGYGGFLGAAQTFMHKMDRAALAQMRHSYDTANNAASKAVEKAPHAVKKDVRAILDLFSSIVARAETGGDALSSGITQSDLMMASNALATLDARLQTVAAQNKVAAQGAFKTWSLALMLVAWGAALLATSLAVWAFGAQDKQLKAPLKALAQSVSNIAHGDMQKSVWGLERTDEVGDLARAIDMARLYFAQIPDLSIVEENGTKRLKFEGEARSLFKDMMRDITRSFEKAEQSTESYGAKMSVHQEKIADIHARLKASLVEIERQDGVREENVTRLTKTLEAAAISLTSAQDSGVAQINRIVPAMQERLQSMAEVTQLTGTQVTHSLQSLLKAEQTLRGTAAQSQQTIKQLAQATSQMGERMFAALNLMQASGKILGETGENARGRLHEAVSALERGESKMDGFLSRAETRLNNALAAEENMAEIAARAQTGLSKIERVVETIGDRHELLNEQVVTAAHRMDGVLANFDAAQRAMSDATGHIRRDSALISNLLAELRKNNDQLLASLSQSSQSGFSAVQNLAEKSHALMQRLEVQIQQQSKSAESHLGELAAHTENMAKQASSTNGALAGAIASLKGEQEKLAATRAKFTDTLGDLGVRLERHATETFGKTEEWASKSFAKLTGLADQMDGVMQRMAMLGQLTGTLGTVAGQLGQIVPALSRASGGLPAVSAPSGDAPIIIDMDETKTLIVRQTEDVLKALNDQWNKAVVQIEAMHDQLAQLVVAQKDQLETRLIVLDKKLKETADALLEDIGEEGVAPQMDVRQNEILNELVAAISKINEHVMEIDETIEDAGLAKKEA